MDSLGVVVCVACVCAIARALMICAEPRRADRACQLRSPYSLTHLLQSQAEKIWPDRGRYVVKGSNGAEELFAAQGSELRIRTSG